MDVGDERKVESGIRAKRLTYYSRENDHRSSKGIVQPHPRTVSCLDRVAYHFYAEHGLLPQAHCHSVTLTRFDQLYSLYRGIQSFLCLVCDACKVVIQDNDGVPIV